MGDGFPSVFLPYSLFCRLSAHTRIQLSGVLLKGDACLRSDAGGFWNGSLLAGFPRLRLKPPPLQSLTAARERKGISKQGMETVGRGTFQE